MIYQHPLPGKKKELCLVLFPFFVCLSGKLWEEVLVGVYFSSLKMDTIPSFYCKCFSADDRVLGDSVSWVFQLTESLVTVCHGFSSWWQCPWWQCSMGFPADDRVLGDSVPCVFQLTTGTVYCGVFTADSQVSWPLTLNKELPSTMGWMSYCLVELYIYENSWVKMSLRVWLSYTAMKTAEWKRVLGFGWVIHLWKWLSEKARNSTPLLKSLNQGQRWQHPCVETWHMKKWWMTGSVLCLLSSL